MKKARVVLFLAVLSVLCLVMVTESMAGWYIASVDFVGKNDGDGNVYLRVTDTAASPKFTFQLVSVPLASQNVYLAIGMTAQVMGSNVGICGTIPEGGNPDTPRPIACIYLY